MSIQGAMAASLRRFDPYPRDLLALDFAGVATGGRQLYKREGIIVPRFEMLRASGGEGHAGLGRARVNGAYPAFAPDAPLIGDRGLFNPSARGSRWVDNRGVTPSATWPTLVNATRAAGARPSPVPGALPVLVTSTGANGRVQRNMTVPNDALRRVFTVWLERKPGNYSVIIGYANGVGASAEAVINGETGAAAGSNATIRPEGDWWRVDIFLNNNGTGNTLAYGIVTLVGAAGQTLEVLAPRLTDGDVIYDPPMVTTLLTDVRTAHRPATLVLDAALQIEAEADFGSETLIHATNGSGGGLRLYRSAGLLYAVTATASAENTPVEVGRWPAGMGALIEVQRDGPEFLIGLHAKPPVPVAAAEVCTELTLGSNAEGASAWNAWIKRLRQSANHQPGGVYDDFDRADGAIGEAWTGQPWVQVAAGSNPAVVEATIAGGVLVAAESGHTATAAYNGIDMGATATELRASMSFGAGADGGAVALITNPNGLATVPNITQKSIHIVFTNRGIDIGFWEAGVYFIPRTYTYETGCLKDGTVYDIGWAIEGETIRLQLPTGSIVEFTDPRVATHGGRYATFEHYWTPGQCPPSIHAAFAR